MILALALLDRKVVDAGDAQPHQAMRVELAILVTVAADRVSAVVVRLVGDAHGDAVAMERPELLDQAIVELPCSTCASGTHRCPHAPAGTRRDFASGCRGYRRSQRWPGSGRPRLRAPAPHHRRSDWTSAGAISSHSGLSAPSAPIRLSDQARSGQ